MGTSPGSMPRTGSPDGAATGQDCPGAIARPPRIAYLFLATGALLGWLRPLPLFPPG
jgi:hypothetical protein